MKTDIKLVGWHEAGHAIFSHLLFGPTSISSIGAEYGIEDKITGTNARFFVDYSNNDSQRDYTSHLYTISVDIAAIVAEAFVASDIVTLKQGAHGDLQAVVERLAETHFKHVPATPAAYSQTLETYIYDMVSEIVRTLTMPSVYIALKSVAELIVTQLFINGVPIEGETVYALIAASISKGEARKIKARFKPAYITGLKEQKRREALNLNPSSDWLFNIVLKAINENKA